MKGIIKLRKVKKEITLIELLIIMLQMTCVGIYIGADSGPWPWWGPGICMAIFIILGVIRDAYRTWVDKMEAKDKVIDNFLK